MIAKATFRQFLSSMLFLFVGFIYGIKEGWILATIKSYLSKDPNALRVSNDDLSWIASISFTSSILSVIVFYFASARFGRKKILIGVASFYVIVWMLILCTPSVTLVLICFWLYGIASGTQYVTGYAYIGEVSSPKNRELIGASYGVATAVGTEVEYLLSMVPFNRHWVLTIFPVIVSISALVASFFMVESPYYLVDRGDEERAIRNLCYLLDTTEEKVHSDLLIVKEYVNEQKNNGLKNNLQVILMPSNLKLTFLMLLLNVLSVAHVAYLVVITGSYVLKDISAFVGGDMFFNIFLSVRIFALFVSYFTIRAFDRRKLMVVGFFMVGLWQLILSLCFHVESINGNTNRWLAITIVCLLVVVLLQVAWSFAIALEILKIEVFPHKMKEFYTSLLLCSGDWAAFTLIKSYFFAEPIIGTSAIVFIYALINFVTAIIVYLFVPRTKDKTLLQIRTDLNAEAQRVEQT